MSESLAARIEGRHVLAGFLAAFAILLTANAIFVYFAVSTFGGLDTEDAYRKGLAYNTTLHEASRQDQLGWVTTLTYDDARNTLTLKIADRAGTPVSGLTVTGRLFRPATNRFDRTLGPFEERMSGEYDLSMESFASGSWIVDLTAAAMTGPPYHVRKRLWLSPMP